MAKKKKKKLTVKGTIDGQVTQRLDMTSEWKCFLRDDGKYAWEKDPTTAYAYLGFEYSIASGSTIKSAYLYFNANLPESGVALFTVNGASAIKKEKVKISLTSTGGAFTVPFVFRANGTKEDELNHSGTLTLTKIKLVIEYNPPVKVTPSKAKPKASDFPVPTQTTYFITQSDGKNFTFDGVVAIQHSLSSKFDEDPSDDADEYKNSAKNEPDKVTIDVMMSDVYTSTGNLTDAHPRAKENTRSAAAFTALHQIKEERELLMVVTPQYIYTDMVLGTVTVNQDENSQYGFEGQLTFQHKYETESSDDDTSSDGTDDDGDVDRTGSWWTTWGIAL